MGCGIVLPIPAVDDFGGMALLQLANCAAYCPFHLGAEMTINVTYSHVKLAAVVSLFALGVSELYAQSPYLLLGVPVAALFAKISNIALGIGVLMSRQNDQTSEDVKAPNATVEPPKPSGT